MNRFSSRTRVAVLIGVITLGAGFFFWYWPSARLDLLADSSGLEVGDGAFNPSEALRHWTLRIKLAGADDAYQEYLKTYASASYNTQHAAAHLMGHALYQEVGIAGLPTCDSSYGFGCYHQFFMDALSAQGTAIVPDLDTECVARYGEYGTGCQHGIGHGLGEYFGNSEQGLLRALTLCDKVTTINEYFGCASGVFMQYNEPNGLEGDRVITEVRPLNSKNPYQPCDTAVPEKYRAACYFGLPQWWMILGASYADVGKRCVAASDAYVESCTLGIGGVVAPREEYDVADTVAACQTMPTARSMVLCRASASWALFAMPDRRKDSAKVCADLSSEDRTFCVQKSDLIGNGEIFNVGKGI